MVVCYTQLTSINWSGVLTEEGLFIRQNDFCGEKKTFQITCQNNFISG